MPWSDPKPDSNGWLQIDIDLDTRRELLYDTKTDQYAVFEEHNMYRVDEARARELFPRAFDL